MGRMLIGSWAMIGVAASTTWAQEAPKPEPGGNLLGWMILVVPVLGVILLFISISRTRKYYNVAASRSLQLAEESNELARQQVALLAETNRLLAKLIGERLEG